MVKITKKGKFRKFSLTVTWGWSQSVSQWIDLGPASACSPPQRLPGAIPDTSLVPVFGLAAVSSAWTLPSFFPTLLSARLGHLSWKALPRHPSQAHHFQLSPYPVRALFLYFQQHDHYVHTSLFHWVIWGLGQDLNHPCVLSIQHSPG